jgi:hypothetical protein
LAKAEGRELKFCSMEPRVRLGAEIHESESFVADLSLTTPPAPPSQRGQRLLGLGPTENQEPTNEFLQRRT